MPLKDTYEQIAIIEHEGNLRVRAGAGCGKTSTLIRYAKKRPHLRFLYIAYNRSVKQEAIHSFKKAGVTNVQIETAHSLAYKGFNVANRFTLIPDGNYKPYDLISMDEFKKITKGDAGYGLMLSRHVLNHMSLFCNSSATFLNEIDYLKHIDDEHAKTFVKSNIDHINQLVSIIMTNMLKGKSCMSHDAYLKYWQLSKPRLDYDVILFDEGQDASPVMLQAFLNQDHATKIIVGDDNQQIYSFRSAINSLNSVDYPELYLSNSFRFPQDIADTAMKAIELKTLLDVDISGLKITGMGDRSRTNNLSATLARTNMSLLVAAIEAVFEQGIENIYFEGDLGGYTYMKEGGGNVFDVMNLYQGKHDKIKSNLISTFQTLEELEEYQEATSDHEIRLMTNIVKKYGSKLSYYLTNLKKHQVNKYDADMIFSTVHKAKGMEYKNVTLCEDFISKEKIQELLEPETSQFDKLLENVKHGGKSHHNHLDSHESKNLPPEIKPDVDINKLTEEINILYVAITRSQDNLFAPDFY